MKNLSVRKLVVNAVFVSLVLLLGLTPIGIIPLGAINVTILHIPVIIGALFYNEQITVRKVAGIAVCLCGVYLIHQ